MKKTLKKAITLVLILVMLLSTVPAVLLSVSADVKYYGVEGLPEVEEGCYRYYFYMPPMWVNEYTDCAGIYWWEGTDACTSWPGYKAKEADVEGVYYYDVPCDVTTIIWNNFLDGGTDYTLDIFTADVQSVNIGSEYYYPGESANYPDGTDSFDGMIYVTDMEKIDVNPFSGKMAYGGEWAYYYGNGEYGFTPVRGEGEIHTDPTFNWLDGPFIPDTTEETATAAPETEATTVVDTPVTDVLNIDGKAHSVSAGDEITYTFKLTTPKNVESVQATTYYDDTKLELIPGTSREMFPVLRDITSVVYNIDVWGKVKFNAIDNIDGGFDFTEGGVLVNLTFRVLDSNGGYIYTQIEEMDEFGTDVRYVEKSEIIVDGVAVLGEIVGNTVPTEPTTETTVVTEATTEATEVTTEATEATTAAPETEATTAAPETEATTVVDTPVTDVLNIDGKTHSVSAGDEITYTFKLTTPKNVESIQATTYYDDTKLELIPGTSREMFPVLRDIASVVYNIDVWGKVKFNSIDNIDGGFDFTEGGVLVNLTFRVLDSNGGYIYTQIEEMDEFGTDVRYVEKSEIIVDGVAVLGEIVGNTVPTEPTTETTVVTEATTEATEATTAAPETEATTAAPKTDVATIIVDGTAFEVPVGETFTYEFTLTTPANIENIQATSYYDETMLELIVGKAREMFPVLRAATSVVYTTDMPGKVKFNATEGIEKGIDFTEGGVLTSFRFKVIAAGTTEISTTIEEMVKFGESVDYATGGQIVNSDVKCVETLYVDTDVTPTVQTTEETTTEAQKVTFTYIVGDADENNDVNIKDATLIQKVTARIETLTEFQSYAADADENNDVNIKDATAIQKHVARIETSYPIGEKVRIIIR